MRRWDKSKMEKERKREREREREMEREMERERERRLGNIDKINIVWGTRNISRRSGKKGEVERVRFI